MGPIDKGAPDYQPRDKLKRKRRTMNAQPNVYGTTEVDSKAILNKRIQAVGWGLILVLTGGLLLVPGWVIPIGSWLVGLGVIQLGANLIQYRNGLRVHGFNLVLGITALTAGLSMFFGLKLPLFEMFLILMGAYVILRVIFEKK
jgi:hypothetical protein